MSSSIEAHSGFIVLVDISGYTRFIMNHKRFGIAALERRNERIVEEHAEAIISVPVSYTHLTLPTICSV